MTVNCNLPTPTVAELMLHAAAKKFVDAWAAGAWSAAMLELLGAANAAQEETAKREKERGEIFNLTGVRLGDEEVKKLREYFKKNA